MVDDLKVYRSATGTKLIAGETVIALSTTDCEKLAARLSAPSRETIDKLAQAAYETNARLGFDASCAEQPHKGNDSGHTRQTNPVHWDKLPLASKIHWRTIIICVFDVYTTI